MYTIYVYIEQIRGGATDRRAQFYRCLRVLVRESHSASTTEKTRTRDGGREGRREEGGEADDKKSKSDGNFTSYGCFPQKRSPLEFHIILLFSAEEMYNMGHFCGKGPLSVKVRIRRTV